MTARQKDEKIRCDACPVMCYIAEGKSGACDRYANDDGKIVRLDPLTILDRRLAAGDQVKPFLGAGWDGGLAVDRPREDGSGEVKERQVDEVEEERNATEDSKHTLDELWQGWKEAPHRKGRAEGGEQVGQRGRVLGDLKEGHRGECDPSILDRPRNRIAPLERANHEEDRQQAQSDGTQCVALVVGIKQPS